jgi:hypothetical protein
MGIYACDSVLLHQAGVPWDLIRIKDFSSDKMVEECSHRVLELLMQWMLVRHWDQTWMQHFYYAPFSS